MKNVHYFLVAMLFPFSGNTQIDSVDNGVITKIDSARNLKIEIPFKNGQVNGTTKGFDLTSSSLILEGSSKNNKKEGVWNYYQYNALGDKLVAQFFTYKNDTLNGPFQQRIDSLLITGNYIRDTLDGQYKEELVTLDDTLNFVYTPVDSGQYKMGVKYGLWTYFKDTNISKLGSYENGKRHSIWKIYDTTSSSEPQLMRETQYFEGIKTGKEMIYFRYDNGVMVREKESIPWQMGILDGTYSKWDSNGVLVETGMYSDNLKIGKWKVTNPKKNQVETTSYLNNVLNGPYTLKQNSIKLVEGTYAQGKKNKVWRFYSKDGTLLREEVYQFGLKEGEWKIYNAKGIWTHSFIYSKNVLVELLKLDKLENEVLNLAMNYSPKAYIKITVEEVYQDSSISKDLMYVSDMDSLDAFSFMKHYESSGQDTTEFKYHGGYSVSKSGTVEYQGMYRTNIKHGNWNYYYNPRIVWRKVFDNGILDSELFFDKNSGAPIEKGEYLLWYGPERPKLEFKIQDGLRHGKSIWYDKSGEEMKVEKYKEGLLN